MSKPGPSNDTLDAVIAQVSSGLSLRAVAPEHGYTADVLSKHLKMRRGFHIKSIPRGAHNRKNFDVAEAILAYERGESPNSIANRIGVTRPTLVARLKEHGVDIRGHADAARLEWTKMTPEQRLNMVEPAHNARRGQSATDFEKLRRAKTVESGRFASIGVFEEHLHKVLVSKGRNVVPQAALGIYNLDLLVDERIAVEIGTAPVNRYRTKYGLRRLEKIAKAGLSFFYIHVSRKDAAIAVVDKIIAHIDEMRCLPSGTREKRVVRCTTHSYARIRDDLGRLAAVPTTPQHKCIVVECDWLV